MAEFKLALKLLIIIWHNDTQSFQVRKKIHKNFILTVIGKSIEIESIFIVAMGWEKERNGHDCLTDIYLGRDENVLELDRGDSCRIL